MEDKEIRHDIIKYVIDSYNIPGGVLSANFIIAEAEKIANYIITGEVPPIIEKMKNNETDEYVDSSEDKVNDNDYKFYYSSIGPCEFSYIDSSGKLRVLKSVSSIANNGGRGTQRYHIINDDHCYEIFYTTTVNNSDAKHPTHIFRELYEEIVKLGEPK